MSRYDTLPHLMMGMMTSFNNPKAFNYLAEGEWQSISTIEFVDQVRKVSLGLRELGLKKGEGVGIISDSSPFWIIMDLSIMIAGGITIPMFANVSTENMLFQIKDSNLKYLFIATEDQWHKLGDNRKNFKNIITLNIQHQPEVGLKKAFPSTTLGDRGRAFTSRMFSTRKIITYQDLLQIGERASLKDPNLYAQLRDAREESEIATIIYTSGSTGLPKGVELTHKNLCSQIDACGQCFPLDNARDKIVSCLPLAHIFERMVTYFFISTGTSIYYVDDIKNVGNILREVRPTTLTLVPRLLEKVHAKMQDNAKQAKGIKKALATLAIKRAMTKDPFKAPTVIDKLLAQLVYKKFLAALGGNFKLMVSGGAALRDDVYRFFLNIGVNLYQGYGLTESSPVIATNYPGHNKVGTVGKPFPGVQVKIAKDGEILAKGPNTMRGYHNKPQLTQDTLSQGWLHTGDLGALDPEGYLSILGRKKEMFKTSNGKYVVPIPLEQKLIQLDLIDMALVIAEGRPFVSCLLFPDFENLEQLKARRQLQRLGTEEFFESEAIQREIADWAQAINKRHDHWEHIQKFTVIYTPLSIEAGDLTPKMNIRRKVVEEKYSQEIDLMYSS